MKRKVISALIVTSAMISNIPALYAQQTDAPAGTHVDIYLVPAAAQIPVVLEYPARLKSSRSATVVSRVSGLLQSKSFVEGATVKKGSLLYKIEPDIYVALVREREADLALQHSLLTKTQRDWERAESLYKDRAISSKELDAARSSYETATAELDAAKAKLESAKINLNYTEVKAPISGITSMKATDLGNLVSSGTPLLTITQTDPIYAEFSIPDTDFFKAQEAYGKGSWASSLQEKLSATVTLTSSKANGHIDYISAFINEKTGSIQARAVFENSTNSLIPGAFARVKIEGLVRKNALSVPQKAVLQNPLGKIVFVVEEGKAALRHVKVGDTSGENFIVEEGLKEGDRVIVNNFFRVKPGAAVIIDKTINSQGK